MVASQTGSARSSRAQSVSENLLIDSNNSTSAICGLLGESDWSAGTCQPGGD